MNSVYRKLKNVHSVVLDCRLGPTLSCLVAEKKLNSQITTFLTQQQSFLIRSGLGGEDKKVGLSKEQAKFEKEGVEEVEDES